MVCDRGCVCEYLWKNVLFCVVFLCVCFEAKPELPQQEEASGPGAVYRCRPSVSVAPAGCPFIPRPNTPAPWGRPTGALLRCQTMCEPVFLCVIISHWVIRSARDWLRMQLVVTRGLFCLQRWRHELCQWVKVNAFTWNGVAPALLYPTSKVYSWKSASRFSRSIKIYDDVLKYILNVAFLRL